MTEEIIIDGVNVAGCIYYNAEKLANCGMFAQGDFKCEGQICLYKQRKRLEQENELLKEQLLTKSEQEQSFQSLLEENRCLHESIDGAQIIINGYIELTGKYKSALEEIREYCKNIADNNKMTNCAMIYEKINEVLK